jgi:hypothetical protein
MQPNDPQLTNRHLIQLAAKSGVNLRDAKEPIP